MSFFDFNFLLHFRHDSPAWHPSPEAVDESWPNRFLSAVRFHPDLPVSSLCQSLSGQPLRQRIFLLGPVPLFGLRATDLSNQSACHRDLSAHPAGPTLSYGLPRTSFSQHAGACQRGSRLAHLSRLRPGADWHRSRPLSQRTFRRGLVRNRVCLRLDHHRFVSVAVSLGSVSPPQECGQAPYPVG